MAAEIQSLSPLASIVAPLPPIPDGDIFTPEQWETLLAICEVFVPCITAGDNSNRTTLTLENQDRQYSQFEHYLPVDTNPSLLKTYLEESPVWQPTFKEDVRRQFHQFVPVAGHQALGFVLSTLNTRMGSLLLTGAPASLQNQDLRTRTVIISKWAQSYFKPLRDIYRSMNGLAKQTWFSISKTIPEILDFPEIPKHIERNPSFEFQFHDFSSESIPTTLGTDVVIIGSGCGAGVIASELSRSGLKCIVVEKSYHFPSSHFPMSASSAASHLMENGGAILSEDQSIAVIAGSTWGGGGTVNWSASLQTPHYVRREWATEHNLPYFTSSEFQDCLDAVCARMGVAKSTEPSSLSKIEHNFANQTILEGARRLGVNANVVPQNTASKRHFCGYCSTGCASTTKQGPANCWLPDAAAHGAEFIEGCYVDKILFSSTDPTLATGLTATWTSRDRKVTRTLNISAKRVIVSAGTLHSPLLLSRSGLTNRWIGRNLHIHPCGVLRAIWPYRVNPWEGSILTSVVTSLENHDGRFHGPKIENICSTPSFANMTVPFRAYLNTTTQTPSAAAIDFKINVLKQSYSTMFISLQRDNPSPTSTRVYPDAHNPRIPHVIYTPTLSDRQGIAEGQILSARICYTMGAVELDAQHPLGSPFVRDTTTSTTSNDTRFETWLSSTRSLLLANPEGITFGSAHQMGTCRMSSDPAKGVVDVRGKVWGSENVYVADASVFPSASGVNPMVTNMGIALGIARGIVKEDEDG